MRRTCGAECCRAGSIRRRRSLATTTTATQAHLTPVPCYPPPSTHAPTRLPIHLPLPGFISHHACSLTRPHSSPTYLPSPRQTSSPSISALPSHFTASSLNTQSNCSRQEVEGIRKALQSPHPERAGGDETQSCTQVCSPLPPFLTGLPIELPHKY